MYENRNRNTPDKLYNHTQGKLLKSRDFNNISVKKTNLDISKCFIYEAVM